MVPRMDLTLVDLRAIDQLFYTVQPVIPTIGNFGRIESYVYTSNDYEACID